MLKIFKNKKTDEKQTSVTFFQMVNQRFTQYGLKLADLINRQTKNWSPRKWKYFLIIFCTVGVTAASYEMVTSIISSEHPRSRQFLTIVSPEYAIHPEVKGKADGALISESEYSRLVQFENYLDSLKNSLTGRSYYDSLMNARSGLMDTIRVIKRLYMLQKSR
jgi:hypothetical protein